MIKVDARGLSCPEPVILFRNAICANENSYEVLVDNQVSKENVIRAAEHLGFRVTTSIDNDDYILSMTK